MRTISRRALVGAVASLPLISACERAQTIVGGDPSVSPDKVSAGALRRTARDPRLIRFYEARGWRAAWSSSDSARLQDALADTVRHGIEPARFTDTLQSADTPAAREAALTRAALAYGDALAHGLADPKELFSIYALERNDLDVDSTLGAALQQDRLQDWLSSLPPGDPGYKALSAAYLAYRQRASQPQPEPIAPGKLLKPGQKDARIPQFAASLQAGGYLTTTLDPSSTTYAPDLVAAMKAFQTDHGLNADGVVGDDTVAVLNAGPDDRARQLALNLEARRWLKRDVPPRRIDVNTACAFLEYFRDGQRVDYRRVVAGKPGDETPNLAGNFSQLIVNPPWHVPDGIAKEEILPKGAGYMAANEMAVIDGRVVQRPGPKSALGLVKFDMQNRHAIYLHDTPSKERFQDNERHFSHGCVRVADAVAFARGLAAEAGKAPEFDTKLSAGETTPVDLGADVPVRLMYFTAFVDPEGRVGFRPDVYGWDAKLATALGMTPPLRQGLASDAPMSIGP